VAVGDVDKDGFADIIISADRASGPQYPYIEEVHHLMPFIVTTVHDPIALVATCRQANERRPQEGCIDLDGQQVSGWIIRLVGVRYPIVCDTLTGLIAYYPRDNAFRPYARIMSFIHRYYAVKAQLQQDDPRPARRNPATRNVRRPVLAA
jgi:hypothetical protein